MNKRFHAPRRSRLTAALLTSLMLPAGLALAQEQQDNDAAPTASATNASTTNLDRVSVVGSRIKRAEIEGPAPVTVITRADIDREGFQTVGDMLQTLSQNTSSSFTGDLGVTGFTPNAQVVNLRNLGPGYTLTLINGRRPPQYPQPYNRDNNVVNIAAIPTSIVERIEVLTGGASAIYGSDAVAGVVNIVLKENFDGNYAKLTVGTTEEGGGDSVDFEVTGGKTGDRWSAVWAFQYGNREPVFASQRDFLSDNRHGPLGDLAAPSLSHVAIRGADVGDGAIGTNAFFPGAAACEAMNMVAFEHASRGDICGAFNTSASRSISNKRQFYSAYGYGTFDVTDTTRLFASANYYSTKAKSSGGTEFWGTSGDQFNRTSAGGTTVYYYDTQAENFLQLQRIFTPGELGGAEAASTIYDETMYDVAFGAQGMFGDRFDWEASANYGKYEYSADRPRLLAKAVHDYFLGERLGYVGGYAAHTLNLDRWNAPITPEIYRSFATRVVNRGETTTANANFNVSGDLFELPAGAVGFAGVLEWNRQTTDLLSDPRTDQLRPLDDQTIYNLTSSGETHGERDRYAIGAEVRVPILDSLSAQIAARWDKYDDISSVDAASTYNVGLEWRPVDSLLVRGSYATSFRAPDMQLVYAQGAASYATILDEYACRAGVGTGATEGPRTRTQCNTSGDPTLYQAQTLIAGNPGLKEEEGESWSAGFVWDIIDDMSLSVDWYRIRLQDAASQFSSTTLLSQEAACRIGSYADGSAPPSAAFCDNLYQLITRIDAPGTPDNLRVQRINNSYINTALQDTTGVDATYRYRLDTDRLGRFTFDVAYSLLLSNEYKQVADEDLEDYRDLPPSQNYWYPERSRVRGSVNWTYNDWSTTVFGTRLGSAWSEAEEAGENAAGGTYGPRLQPYMVYNLSVAKKFGPNVTAQLQVINVLDNQYREDNSYTAYPFFNPWLGADPLGRRYYVSIGYRF